MAQLYKDIPTMPTLSEADLRNISPHILEALANLNHIGASINRFSISASHIPSANAAEAVGATLLLIAESATKVVPGASAVIYEYNQALSAFNLASRVSAGETASGPPRDTPRANGIGARAISQRRRVISYEEGDLSIHPAKVQAGAKAMACFPLVVANQTVGTLYVYVHEDQRFNQFELLMLDNFVNLAAMAIYQARQLANARNEIRRKEEELNRLGRAGLLLSSRMGLEPTLQAILDIARDVTNAHYGSFRLVDTDHNRLITQAIVGEHAGRPHDEDLPIDNSSIMGWVAEHRQPLCIHDLYAAPWNRIYYPLDEELRMRAELAVPLIGFGGRLEGVLNLESPRIGAFSEEDSLLLQSLATQAVIAIQEARLLDALLDVAKRLLTQSYEDVLHHIVNLACDLLNMADSAIWTLEGEALVLHKMSTGTATDIRLPLHESLTGQAVMTGIPVKCADLGAEPQFLRPPLAEAQNWHGALIVPIRASSEQQALGTLCVYNTSEDEAHHTTAEWNEKVLTCLAHYAALALQNAQRQKALRDAQEQRAIAEAFAAVGDIAANVLHHLNNKVGTIPVRVQGIQDKCAEAVVGNAYLASNLAEIEKSAHEAMAAVRDNLTNLRPLNPAPVVVAECVATALETASLPDGIHIHKEDLEQLPPVLAGKRSLVWVFHNLLDNAVKALQGNGQITIAGRETERGVILSVHDDGPGIAPDLHARIFEFDFSGRKGRSDKGRLGFGLWWVKTLLMRLGGTITVESDGQSGTTFYIQLPLAEET